MKPLVSASLIAALGAVLPLQAATIFSWETGTEGWTASDGATLATTAAGATDGAQALEITMPNAWMWYATPLQINLDEAGRQAIFNEATTITLDVSFPDPGHGSWQADPGVELIIQGDGVAWTPLGEHVFAVGSAPQTFSWAVSEAQAGALVTGSWAQVIVKFTYGNGGEDGLPVSFRLDNFTSDAAAIPEPSTLAALLGALGFLAFRRR